MLDKIHWYIHTDKELFFNRFTRIPDNQLTRQFDLKVPDAPSGDAAE